MGRNFSIGLFLYGFSLGRLCVYYQYYPYFRGKNKQFIDILSIYLGLFVDCWENEHEDICGIFSVLYIGNTFGYADPVCRLWSDSQFWTYGVSWCFHLFTSESFFSLCVFSENIFMDLRFIILLNGSRSSLEKQDLNCCLESWFSACSWFWSLGFCS